MSQCSIVSPNDPSAPPKVMTFDGSYYTDSTTESIYNELAYPLVEVSLTIVQYIVYVIIILHHHIYYSSKLNTFVHFRVCLKATMEPFLPTDKRVVANHIPCKELPSPKHKEELYLVPLNTFLRRSIRLKI